MRKILSILLIAALVVSCAVSLSACSGGSKFIMIWGPEEQRELYLQWAEEVKGLHPDELKGYSFDYA